MKAKVLAVTFIFIGTLIIALSTTGQNVPEEAKRHVTRGLTAIETAASDSALEEAIAEFKKAIEIAPGWSDPYYHLGTVLDRLGRYEEACSYLKKSLELQPNSVVQEYYYKVEFKRDKQAKNEQIIQALLSGIKNKRGQSIGGICYVQSFLRENGQIQVRIASMYPEFNQTVPVDFDGPVFKFKFVYYGCPAPSMAGNPSYPCPWDVRIEARIISTSPLRLKVTEKCLRKFNEPFEQTFEGEWEFNR
jgi:tetratricopeptide (TPR) repeat protein